MRAWPRDADLGLGLGVSVNCARGHARVRVRERGTVARTSCHLARWPATIDLQGRCLLDFPPPGTEVSFEARPQATGGPGFLWHLFQQLQMPRC